MIHVTANHGYCSSYFLWLALFPVDKTTYSMPDLMASPKPSQALQASHRKPWQKSSQTRSKSKSKSIGPNAQS
jgi:hypothetical protein